MAALMLSVFTVSVGYGVVLPALPSLIERLMGVGSTAARVSRHTGLLTAVYMLALFLFAAAWGRASDRVGRRGILCIGLVGFGATMLLSLVEENLATIYAQRFLSGVFAAAVTPVASATIVDLAATSNARAHRLTLVSLAGISGFLFGPSLGVFIAREGPRVFGAGKFAAFGVPPSIAIGLVAFLAAAAVAATVAGSPRGEPSHAVSGALASTGSIVPRLLVLTFIVSAGIGVFEVGLALRGKLQLGLTPYEVATMFAECSLVMIVVQAIVFSPWTRADTTRWLIAPALMVLAVGLFVVPRASDFATMVFVVGAVAASAGILSPILTYWISSMAGHAQGAQLGRQTAASSLGATIGSAAGGLLFGVGPLPGASFVLMAVLTALAVLISVGSPSLLMLSRPAPQRGLTPR